MDNNLKDYLNWKNSKNGKKFEMLKDFEEIEKLNSQSVFDNNIDSLDLFNDDNLQIISEELNSQIEDQYSVTKEPEIRNTIKQKVIEIDNKFEGILAKVQKEIGADTIREEGREGALVSTEVSSEDAVSSEKHAGVEKRLKSMNESYIIKRSVDNKSYSNSNNGGNFQNERRSVSEKPASTRERDNAGSKVDDRQVANEALARTKIRKIYFQITRKDKISIEADFYLEPEIMTLIKTFGGRFDREGRVWFVPLNNYTQLYLKMVEITKDKHIRLYPITELPIFVLKNAEYSILKYKDNKSKNYIEINYNEDKKRSILELPPKMLSMLYNFQKAGIDFGIKHKGRILLADEMGVGKTIQAVGIASIYKEDWPVLILCPSSLKYSWKDEILNWLEGGVSENEVHIVKTSKENFNKKAKFFLISYDLSIRMADKIDSMNFKIAIADEAHYLKSQDAKRTQLMIPILQKCKRLLMLSGTPILAKPIELYPILRALRPDLFSNFKAYITRYCDPKNTAYGIDNSGSSNAKELHFLLSQIIMIRRLKKDVMDQLPPKKRQKVEINIDNKLVNEIRVLLNKAPKFEKESDCTAEDLAKLEEIKDSTLETNNCFNKAYLLTGKAKIPGIVEYIKYLLANNCKFLIFAHHLEVLDSIEEGVKGLKVKYIRIDGSVNTERRHEYVKTFQTDETCLVAVLGITACATGITLTKASTVVFAEMYFTPAIMMQAEDRAHRIGQEHKCVNVHYLYANDTVDAIIFPKLRTKFFVVTSTLDNKKMDMEVHRLKSGKVGDFEASKGESGSKRLIGNALTLPVSASKNNDGKISVNNNNNKKTIVDYFKKRDGSVSNDNTAEKVKKIGIDVHNESFVHQSFEEEESDIEHKIGVKNQEILEDCFHNPENVEKFNFVEFLNIHDGNYKRNRKESYGSDRELLKKNK